MHLIQTKHLYLCSILISMSGLVSLPAMAEQLEMVDQSSYAAIPRFIERIVSDPDRTYESVYGPDDCSSESLYNAAMEVLAGYAVHPTENSPALKKYILSGEAQCNCTEAIVGKDFDNLLEQLGSDISEVPCL